MSTKHTWELANTDKIRIQTKQNILKHYVIHEHNATMGGEENLTRVINSYNMQRKGSKWHSKLAEFSIDIAVYSSFILWKQINNSNIDQLQFQQDIINNVIMFCMAEHQTHQTDWNPGAITFCERTRLVDKHFIELIPCRPGEEEYVPVVVQ